MMLGYMGSIYMSLLVPLYLEGTAGYSAFIAGCLLAAPILCYAGACFVGGRIEDKHGIWPLVPAGFLLILVAFIGMKAFSSIGIALAVVACAAAAYIGVGLVFPTLKASDLGVLPPAIYSFGSSIHSTLVQIAGSVGCGPVRGHHVRRCRSPHGHRRHQGQRLCIGVFPHRNHQYRHLGCSPCGFDSVRANDGEAQSTSQQSIGLLEQGKGRGQSNSLRQSCFGESATGAFASCGTRSV